MANFPDDFEVAQSEQNAKPATIASAATITPQHKFNRVTGTTPVTRIIPPTAGYHELTFVWTTGTANAFTTGVTLDGGIAVTTTSVTNVPQDLCYDPRTKLYYVKA